MEDNEFLDRVLQAFQAELTQGVLRVVSHEYKPEAFGNATAVLGAPDLLLVIVRDRSLYYAQVAHPKSPTDWAPLQMAVAAASGRASPDYYHPHGHEIDIDSAAIMFREHRNILSKGYGKDWRDTRKRLKRIQGEYLDRMTAWHSSPEGKRSYAEMVARTETAVRNMSPEELDAYRKMGIRFDDS